MAESEKNIIVTGANGQLGRCLQKASLNLQGFSFHFLGREHLPIDNHTLTRSVLASLKPYAVINTAAYTAVDRAESERTMADNINGYAVGNIAKFCNETGAGFIHISTDYVFDGKADKPYTTSSPTNPVNAYGDSKLLGERLALSENPLSVIIRTSWVYSAYGSNFVKTMRRLMAEREMVKVVNDQFGCPTYAMDLAAAILKIIDSEEWKPGIYHYCNKGVISWFDFAMAIKETGGFSCEVLPIPTSQYPTPARRPFYSALDCSDLKMQYQIEPPFWKDSLIRAMHDF